MKRKRSPVETAKSLIGWHGTRKLAEASFLAAAARGNPERGLRLLDKLNRQDRKNRIVATKP